MARRRLAALLFCVFAAAGPAHAQPDVIRDSEQLRALFSNRTLNGHYLSGEKFKEYYSPDGRTAYFQLQCLHSGTWWIQPLSEDFGAFEAGTPLACFYYPTLDTKDDPSCFAVGGPKGAEHLYAIGGNPAYTGLPAAFVDHWAPGNPESLPLDQDGCPSV